MTNNLMNQEAKWEEFVSLTDRELNQLAIKQDPVCQKMIRDIKNIEEFLNSFEDFALERKLIVCRKSLISLNAIMTSLKFTAGSIISCCESGCMADANTLLRKYRDDMFFYLYIVVYNENQFGESAQCKIKEMEINIERWVNDGLKDLNINTVLSTIAFFPEMKSAISEYRLKSFFDSLGKRLNNYVHSNGVAYYNHRFDSFRRNRLEEDLGTVLTDIRYITVSFLFLLTLCTPNSVMATDYIDYLDFNMVPPTDSQYWVAPFVEDFFRENLSLIDKSCIDYLREKTSMEFE